MTSIWPSYQGCQHCWSAGNVNAFRYTRSRTRIPTHKSAWASRSQTSCPSFVPSSSLPTSGSASPDPEAFIAVAERIGFSGLRAVVLRSTPENVDGARTVWMRAVLVESSADVGEALLRLGIGSSKHRTRSTLTSLGSHVADGSFRQHRGMGFRQDGLSVPVAVRQANLAEAPLLAEFHRPALPLVAYASDLSAEAPPPESRPDGARLAPPTEREFAPHPVGYAAELSGQLAGGLSSRAATPTCPRSGTSRGCT